MCDDSASSAGWGFRRRRGGKKHHIFHPSNSLGITSVLRWVNRVLARGEAELWLGVTCRTGRPFVGPCWYGGKRGLPEQTIPPRPFKGKRWADHFQGPPVSPRIVATSSISKMCTSESCFRAEEAIYQTLVTWFVYVILCLCVSARVDVRCLRRPLLPNTNEKIQRF